MDCKMYDEAFWKKLWRQMIIHACVCACVCVCVCVCCSVMLDSLWPPWTVACQTPLSMEFVGQEYWSGLPCLPQGNLPDPVINPSLLWLLHWQADSLPLSPWEAFIYVYICTHIHTCMHTFSYIYTHIYVCVCVCVCVYSSGTKWPDNLCQVSLAFLRSASLPVSFQGMMWCEFSLIQGRNNDFFTIVTPHQGAQSSRGCRSVILKGLL